MSIYIKIKKNRNLIANFKSFFLGLRLFFSEYPSYLLYSWLYSQSEIIFQKIDMRKCRD